MYNMLLYLLFTDPLTSPNSSLFNDFAALSVSQRRKVGNN